MFAKRSLKTLCGFAVMLVLAASITCVSASALDNGAYTAKCSPHYRHPVTGEIEDSGGEENETLGQSMTEGATHTEALIEVDPDGNMFATVRLKLMDNIQDPTFKVQNRGDSGFWDVSHDIMKEDFDRNESDFRFPVPNESCIVRATFYVVPMGRDVIYYIDFSDIREGSSDFIVSVEIKEPETETQPPETEPPRTEPQTTTTPAATKAPETTIKTDSSSKVTTTTTTAPSAVTPLSDDSSTADSSSMTDPSEDYTIPDTVGNGAKGVAFFDERGNEIFPLSKNETEKGGRSDETKNGRNNAALPIGIACGVVVIGGAGGFAAYRRRRL